MNVLFIFFVIFTVFTTSFAAPTWGWSNAFRPYYYGGFNNNNIGYSWWNRNWNSYYSPSSFYNYNYQYQNNPWGGYNYNYNYNYGFNNNNGFNNNFNRWW